MAVVNISINGQAVQAQAGQTVLEAATAAGIEIPTLCSHPALKPDSICRICVVEVERARVLQPACTFPVGEGMVIRTDSEKVIAARKTVLQLLFSQRLHYCMYCTQAGNSEDVECELQRLAYRYGLVSWRYEPDSQHRWPVDASRSHFIMDHNRCIMCRRCVRACSEIVANHTLSIRGRGARTMIIADNDVPFGESSCVSCGTCLQVCPTGALIDRRSAFLGHASDMERIQTTCMACAVGCTIKAVTRSNIVHRIEGDWDAANGGLLCVDGRFGVVEAKPKRVTAPLLRKGTEQVAVSLDEALAVAAGRLGSASKAAGLASPRLSSEALAAFGSFCTDALHTDQMSILESSVPPLDLGQAGVLGDLPGSDCVVVVGGNPFEEQRVLAYLASRAVNDGGALIVVADGATGLDNRAKLKLSLAEIGQVEGIVQAAQRPVVVYAAGLADGVYKLLRALPKTVRFLPLVKGTNALAATRLGFGTAPVQGDALYILAGDDVPTAALPKAAFTVVQAAYHTAWTEAADVVLPAQVWSERSGHVTNLEGRELPLVAATKSPAGVLTDEALLDMLAKHVKAARPVAAQ